MTNRQQFVQQYSENDMVLKVRAGGAEFGGEKCYRAPREGVFFVGFFLSCRSLLMNLLCIFSFSLFSSSQELEMLDEDANVYKLIGPVLIKQDLVEAKSNVGKRLEFISNET